MSVDKRAILKEWLTSGKATLQPLTFPQRELWEASPVPVGDTANHICCLIHVRGVMNPRASEVALQRVIDRQEVLRLSILPGKEAPLQMIRRSGEQNLVYRDLKASERSDEAVEAIATEIFHTPVDLVQGPLFRVSLLRRGPDENILVFAIHHAIADGWTLGVFVEDLCLGYVQETMGIREPLPPVPLTYSAWSAAERGYWTPEELEKRAVFWRPELAGRPRLWDALEGPATAKGPHQRQVTYFSSALADAAQELARIAGATLYTTLLAAFQVALARWTGRSEFVIGTPFANRAVQSVRETMGYCASVVPLRVRIDPGQNFSDYLRAVNEKSLDCSAHAMPFAELVRAVGDASAPGHNPVYEVRFALQNHPVPDVSLHGLSTQVHMRSTGTARFHLACEITIVPAGLELAWLFRPQLFPAEEITELFRLYTAVLESVCRTPDTRIAEIAT